MRIDRTVTLRLAAPLNRLTGRAHAEPALLPILMYHGIDATLDQRPLRYLQTTTSPERFAAQMQWLADEGWRGMSVTAALQQRSQHVTPRPVALTFDDGQADFLEHALPVLQRHQFTATVYLPTAFIGTTRRRFQGAECMTWTEARAVQAAGIELGAHSVTHTRLVDLDSHSLWRELLDSRQEIERNTGHPVRAFSYPYAFPAGQLDFVNRLHDLLLAAGYDHCATTLIGRAATPQITPFFPRLPVNGADDRALFRAKLAGDYDWLGTPQRWLKRLRAAVTHPLSA